jgi:DNA-binding response OmpR family regulator
MKYSNVLLVDDDADYLEYLSIVLSDINANIITSLSGKDAMEKIDHNTSVVVLDINMPDMNGIDVAEAIKHKDREIKDHCTPIIFLTGISTASNFSYKGYEAGAVDFLYKPVDPLVLKCKINVFLSIAKMRQKIGETNEKLEESMAVIRSVRKLFPECNYCGDLRKLAWTMIETYITENPMPISKHPKWLGDLLRE